MNQILETPALDEVAEEVRYQNLSKYKKYELLKEAFGNLRKNHRFIAKMNYGCCMICADAGISNQYENMTETRKSKVNGTAYFHRQDTQSFWRYGKIHIRYFSMNDANTVQVGKTIVQELENVGLRSEWDGDPDKTITVI